jgi:hypothetical protein
MRDSRGVACQAHTLRIRIVGSARFVQFHPLFASIFFDDAHEPARRPHTGPEFFPGARRTSLPEELR